MKELDRIQNDIDSEIDMQMSFTELKQIKRTVNIMLTTCQLHFDMEKELQSAQRRKFYNQNPETVLQRIAIKESFIRHDEIKAFNNHTNLNLTKEEYRKTDEISGLLSKLNYLATFIK